MPRPSAARSRGIERGTPLNKTWLAIMIRILRSAATLLACATLVFVTLRLAGDPVETMFSPETPAEVIETYRQRWGLDQPMLVQYLAWLSRLAVGDLGLSYESGQPVAAIIGRTLPATLMLGITALLIASVLGLAFGTRAAMRRGTRTDRALMTVAVFGYAMPVFFMGILLILLFAMSLRVLPSSGHGSLAHLIMPAMTLALPLAGRVARFSRTATLEVLGRPFIRAARARGLTQAEVMARHALPNAMVPMLMFYGVEIGQILAGAVVTETIFAWPGLGRLLVDSVTRRDLPVVQAVILTVAAIIVLANLAMDLLHGWMDPRVGLSRTIGALE